MIILRRNNAMVNNYTHSVNYHAKSKFEIARINRSIYMLSDLKALSVQYINIDVESIRINTSLNKCKIGIGRSAIE